MFSKTFRLGNDIDEGKTALRLNLGNLPSNIETAHAGKVKLKTTTGDLKDEVNSQHVLS